MLSIVKQILSQPQLSFTDVFTHKHLLHSCYVLDSVLSTGDPVLPSRRSQCGWETEESARTVAQALPGPERHSGGSAGIGRHEMPGGNNA